LIPTAIAFVFGDAKSTQQHAADSASRRRLILHVRLKIGEPDLEVDVDI
jgi:hypothetical protein